MKKKFSTPTGNPIVAIARGENIRGDPRLGLLCCFNAPRLGNRLWGLSSSCCILTVTIWRMEGS